MAIDPRQLTLGGPGLPSVPTTGAPTSPPGISEAMARAPEIAEQPNALRALLGLSSLIGKVDTVGDRIAQLLSRMVQISDELTKIVSENPQYMKALRAMMAMAGTKGGATGKRKEAGETSLFGTLASTPPPVPPATPSGPPSPTGHPVVVE
jgi:hypothetical protein